MRLREKIQSSHEKILTVLDIGTKKVCCLIARVVSARHGKHNPGEEIHIIGFGHQASQGMRSGVVRDLVAAENSVRAAVSKAEEMAGIEVKNVLLAVACGRLKSLNYAAETDVTWSAVRQHDIEKIVNGAEQFAIQDGRQLLHLHPINYILDGNSGVKDPLGMVGNHLSIDFHALTADYQPLRNLCLVVERCHLNIQGLVAAPYASGLATVAEDEAKLGVMCIDIGGWTTTLSVFLEGHFIYADVIAMGSEQITSDIADALSMPLEEAERIKNFYGGLSTASSDANEVIKFHRVGEEFSTNSSITRSQLVDLIRPRMTEILTTISEHLEKSGMAALSGQRVVLTGGGSQLPGLAQFAASLFGKAVRIGQPFPVEGLPEQGVSPAFSVPLGLLRYPFQPRAKIRKVSNHSTSHGHDGYVQRLGTWLKENF
ncbi:MAG: cell division protein FtsA [Pseudomonadota bacterium]